ncbi:hypothetical protein [Nocardioides oleivorans]|uniref:hypothetical protein n=1 Tax=Nocardioides oleivorans TaxID=273676 RepID=UPI001A934A1A|nr:hypothetical protein [Nocardioides oleivorans]
MTWSKWVCTGATASRPRPSRPRPSRASAASIRNASGSMRRSSTDGSAGREKKPSVITALSPSSTSRLDTPRNVTASPPEEPGTSNRSA